MSQIIMPRRRFLAGLVGLVAAPMVVRAAALMPVKSWADFESFQWAWTARDAFPHLTGNDMVDSCFVEKGDSWVYSMVIHHRADLVDLAEPYLSLVRKSQDFRFAPLGAPA